MTGAPIYTASADERALAADWHGGQGSMLYAVASTGGLSRGTEGYRAGRTDEEWSADLLARLTAEVEEVATLAREQRLPGDAELAEAWADSLAELGRCNDDRYAVKVAGAIAAVDAEDASMFYVRAFVVAESGEPVSVWLWDGDKYMQTTR